MEEFGFFDILNMMKKRWKTFVVVTAVIMALASAYSVFTKHTTYTAVVNVLIGQSTSITENTDPTQIATLRVREMNTIVKMAETSDVSALAAKNMGVEGSTLEGTTKVALVADSDLVTVTTTGSSKEETEKVANAMANALTQRVKEQLGIDNSQVIGTATATATSTSGLKMNLVIAFVMGILISFLWVFFKEMTNPAIRNVEELKKKVGNLPILVAIPKDAEDADLKEAYRSLRTAVTVPAQKKGQKVFTVTSFGDGEGKTTVAMGLAKAMADMKKSVLLVDGNLRAPHIAQCFEVTAKVGLSDVLKENATLSEAVVKTKVEGLAILPAGEAAANPSELLAQGTMIKAVDTLKEKYDYMIIDAPSAAVTDPAVLTNVTDGYLVVAAIGETRIDTITPELESITSIGGEILGVIANKKEG